MVVILLWYTVWKFVNIRVKPGKTICWNGTFFWIAVPNGLGEEGFLSTSIIFIDIKRGIGIATTLIRRSPLSISCPLPYTMEWTHTIHLRNQNTNLKGKSCDGKSFHTSHNIWVRSTMKTRQKINWNLCIELQKILMQELKVIHNC